MINVITEQTTGRRQTILKALLEKASAENIKDFQAAQGLTKDGAFGMLSYRMLYNVLLRPVTVPFRDYPVGQVFPKKQIVLHHSAGWDNARGMFQDWDSDARRGVCTSCGVNDDGKLFKGFDESEWGHALGVEEIEFKKRGIKNMSNLMLNRQAIQIEICAFGGLTKRGNVFQNYVGGIMPEDKVEQVPFRGYPAFERYTQAEIDTVEKWILLNAMRFDIPLVYQDSAFWNTNSKALSGQPGVWGHCSFRADKSDPYPSEKLLKMLKNLESYES